MNAVAPAYGTVDRGLSLGGQPTGLIDRPADHSAARKIPTCPSSQLRVSYEANTHIGVLSLLIPPSTLVRNLRSG
jgi:hypothetical protein